MGGGALALKVSSGSAGEGSGLVKVPRCLVGGLALSGAGPAGGKAGSWFRPGPRLGRVRWFGLRASRSPPPCAPPRLVLLLLLVSLTPPRTEPPTMNQVIGPRPAAHYLSRTAHRPPPTPAIRPNPSRTGHPPSQRIGVRTSGLPPVVGRLERQAASQMWPLVNLPARRCSRPRAFSAITDPSRQRHSVLCAAPSLHFPPVLRLTTPAATRTSRRSWRTSSTPRRLGRRTRCATCSSSGATTLLQR